MRRFHENPLFPVALVLVALVGLAGCAPQEEPVAEEPVAEPEPAPAETAEPILAVAELHGREGSDAAGTVSFTEVEGMVHVVANLEGLEPGTHGFHIHETGDCSAPDFTSAGGHFNPTGAPHACPPEPERHAGDLGNVEVGEDGIGELEISSDMIGLGDDASSVPGKAVVVHAAADDCQSQPSGAAGERVLCGVIELSAAAAGMEAEMAPAEGETYEEE